MEIHSIWNSLTQYMHLLEGKLALKMSVFGGQEDVSYCWTHSKKFILNICRRKEHDLRQEFANANSAPAVNTSTCSDTQYPRDDKT